mgnify:FL=1
MANPNAKGVNYPNVAGMIYVVLETIDPIFGSNTSGFVPIKLGISYGDIRSMKFRLKKQKTGSSNKKQVIASFAVDQDTDIPTPEGTLGGVFEMEQYLHSVFLAYGWKRVGEGTEWFAVPQAVAQMLNDIRANKNGANKKVNWAACPELARAYGYAPEHDEVPSFAEERAVQLKGCRYTKISTVKRSKMEERMDAIAPRSYARDYMLRRGAVEC